jgi:hypothetical protein
MPLAELEAQLRVTVRARIASGELPCSTPPLRMWGGYGSGKVCAACDKIIEPSDVEYEVEKTIEGAPKLMWFHLVCQSIWQLECARTAYLHSRGKKPKPKTL